MSYEWKNHDGILTCMVNGELPEPFVYIVAKAPPPWVVEPLQGESRAFETEDAAKLALILSLTN